MAPDISSGEIKCIKLFLSGTLDCCPICKNMPQDVWPLNRMNIVTAAN